MKTPFYEIFGKVAANRSIPRRVKILQRYESPQLIELIAYAVNPNIKFELPEGDPPFRPADSIDMEEQLYQRVKTMPNFISHCGTLVRPKLSGSKREMLFIQLLENVHPEDAKILIQIKDKELKYVNLEVAKLAFPDHFRF